MVAWMRRHSTAGTVVYTGSTSVYSQDGGAVVDEAAPTEPASEKARILLEAEVLLRDAGDDCARWFILRLAGLYGPGRWHLLNQVRSGVVSGLGDRRLNLIHRDDAASAIRACLLAPPGVRNEILNVADDGAAPKAEVVTWLARRLGQPPPEFTGAPAAGRARVTPDRVIANAKAKRILGWKPQYPTFREGWAFSAGAGWRIADS